MKVLSRVAIRVHCRALGVWGSGVRVIRAPELGLGFMSGSIKGVSYGVLQGIYARLRVWGVFRV